MKLTCLKWAQTRAVVISTRYAAKSHNDNRPYNEHLVRHLARDAWPIVDHALISRRVF